jgi:hypothetical protein
VFSVPNALATFLLFAQVYLAPILTTLVSVAYFLTSPHTQPLIMRVLSSAHGIVIALVYWSPFILSGFLRPSETMGRAFLSLLCIPFALMLTSFFTHKGKKAMRALQVVNLAGLLWTSFIDGMATSSLWL